MFSSFSWLKALAWIMVMVLSGLVFIIVYFYRDPERGSTASSNKIVAPADGRILKVERVREGRFMKTECLHIAIFMHIGNVHVQRIPTDGELVWTEHALGKFFAVLDKRAAVENEQRWYGFNHGKQKYALVQIAGMFAKRTISWLTLNQQCCRGERLGMIALGSEVDLYLPTTVTIEVKPGQKVKAGESVIGSWEQ